MTAILNTNYLIAEAAIEFVAGLIVGVLWAVFSAFALLVTHWRPVALVAGLVGAVAVCVTCPFVPVALALIAAFAWATYPGGAK